jgi:5-methylcytosine-specific restriction protein A
VPDASASQRETEWPGMTTLPLRVCSAPNCYTLVRSGRCPEHGTQRRQVADSRRGTRTQRGYDSKRWQPSRDRFIQEYPLCGMRPKDQPPVMSRCHDEGRHTPAAQVDHVIPHRGDQALFWDREGNWQSLCASCGGRKSAAGL